MLKRHRSGPEQCCTGKRALVPLLWQSYLHAHIDAELRLHEYLPCVLAIRASKMMWSSFAKNEANGISLKDLTLNDFLELLVETGQVKKAELNFESTQAILKIKGCAYARIFHPELGERFICPHALMVFALLKRFFKDVKFSEGLSRLTKDGSITVFDTV